MNSLLSYEIGGIFLLCALLMLGTMSGFVPRLRAGKSVVVVALLLMLAWVAYRHWPVLSAWVSPAAPAAAPTSAPAKPPVVSREKTPPAKWKTTVVDDSVPAPATPAASEPESAPPPASAPAPPAEPDKQVEEGGRVKRTLRRVGRLLHGGKSEEKQ
jgi:hypothetical protein